MGFCGQSRVSFWGTTSTPRPAPLTGAPRVRGRTETEPAAAVALDLDGDGDDDLATGGEELRLWINVRGADFREAGEEATLRLSEKGSRRRTIGIHFEAAQAIREYLEVAEELVLGAEVREVEVKV